MTQGLPGDAAPHWLNAERLKVYPRIFIALYLAVGTAYVWTIRDGLDFRGQVIGADFLATYSAAKLAITGNATAAWDFAVLLPLQQSIFPGYTGGGFPWFYPPPFLLLVAPLALLPYLAAFGVFIATTTAAWVGVVRRAVNRPGAGWLIAAFPGLWVCAAGGQNGMLTAALAGGAVLLHKQRPMLAGVLLGLLVIKPHLAVFFAVALIAARAWKMAFAALGTALACFAVSMAVFGPQVLISWLDSLPFATAATESGALPWSKMPTLFAALRLLGAAPEFSYLAHAVLAIAGAVAIWLVWRRSDSVALRGAVLLAATFLANPHNHDYDLVWLALPIVWLACYGIDHGWRRGDREVLVAAWLLPAVSTALAVLTNIQIGPIVLGLVIWITVRRVLQPDGGSQLRF